MFLQTRALYNPGVGGSWNWRTNMVLRASGDVGIGTTSPTEKLNVVTTGGKSTISIGNTAASTYSQLLMYGGSGKYNWSIGAQYNVDNALEITPSTATGGTTFSTPVVTILQSGGVGIGTTSPSEKLQVSGNAYIAGEGNAIYFDTNGSTKSISQYVANLYEFHINNSRGNGARLILGNGSISLGTGATEMFYINTTTGNIGIGTTSPSAYLQVRSSISDTGSQTVRIVTAYSANAVVDALHIDHGGAGAWTDGVAISIGYKSTAYGSYTSRIVSYLNTAVTTATKLQLQTQAGGGSTWNTGILIDDTGRVGIGTTSPGQMLDVNGRIRIGSNAQTEIYSSSNRVVFRGENTDNVAQIAAYGIFLPITGQTYNLYQAGSTLLGYTDATATLDIARGSSGATIYVRLNSNGDSYLNGGNVGIGQTSPSAKLQVASGTGTTILVGRASGNSSIKAGADADGGYLSLDSNGGAAIINHYVADNVWLVTGGGNVGIGLTAPLARLHVSASNSAYLRGGDDHEFWDINVANTAGLYGVQNSAEGGLKLGSGGGTLYGKSGYIGIGNTTPSYTLDVTGDIRTSGGVIIRNSSPTVYFQDTDHRSAFAHVNSNIFYILRGSGTDSTSWTQYNGYWPLQIDLETNNAQFGGEIRTYVGEIVTNLNFVQYNSSYIRTTRDSVYLNSRIGGRITNANPQFINGTVSGWTVYNNSGGSNLTHTIVSEGTINYIPNSTGKALKISYNGSGGTSPGFGGFYFATTNPSSNGAVNNDNQYRQGQRMMVRIMANIPSGRDIAFASNGYGDNSFQSWLTSTAGTGDWEEYVMVQQIGKGGTISSTHFFYIAGGSDVAFDWYVAYAESVDLDAPTDIKNSSGLSVGYDTTYNSVAAGYGGIGVSGDIIVNGEVGIGTNTPAYKLHVVGNTYVSGYIQAGGTGYFGGDVIAYYSDKRLKKDIESIGSALDKISKIGGYYYTPNDLALQLNADTSSKRRMGVLAQEVQEVFPEAIEKAPFDMGHNMESISGENYLTVKYERLIPVLIEAIKEQQKQIEELKYLLTNK